MGSDLSVANAARVSFGKKSEMDTSDQWGPPKLKEKDAKLIHYLAKHKHMSPFGHAFASFHVKAPIFVARQLVKHKFLRWNEISRRYVEDDPEFYMPDQWRGRADDKKQGSAGIVDIDKYWTENVSDDGWTPMPSLAYEDALYCYHGLLNAGVCPEQARMVLPQSIMTEWYWSGSLDAFADMCNLRCKEDTQLETLQAAQCVSQGMRDLFPVSWGALVDG